MQYTIQLDGFEGRPLVIEVPDGLANSARLTMDGQSVAAGAKRNQYRLRRNDGAEVPAEVKFQFPDPVPLLKVDGKPVLVAPGFSALERGLAMLPVALLVGALSISAAGGASGGSLGASAIRGAIGGGLGYGGIMLSAAVMKSQRPRALKVAVPILITVLGCALIFGISTALGVAFRGAATPAAWAEFRSGAGRFAVQVPGGSLEEQTQTVDTQVGTLTMYTLSRSEKTIQYGVNYADYPAEVVAQSDPGKMLQGAQDGALNSSNSRLVSDRVMTLGGHPGRQYKAESQDGKYALTARIYLVDNRLYQVVVITPPDQSQPENVARFLDSFRLVEE